MKIYVIFGQRIESYEGENAPEARDVIDEYSDEGNPEWLIQKLAEHRKESSFESVELIAIEIDENSVMCRLRPASVPILGAIVP